MKPLLQHFWAFDKEAISYPPDDQSRSITLMLGALKTSFEAYMAPEGFPNTTKSISIPKTLSTDQETHLKSITREAGFLSPHGFISRPYFDISAERIFNSSVLEPCGWDPICEPTIVVLVINFSNAVLSLDLFFVDSGVMEPVRSATLPDLGLESIVSSPNTDLLGSQWLIHSKLWRSPCRRKSCVELAQAVVTR